MYSKQKEKRSWFKSWYHELVFWVVVIFIVRTFGFGLYQVPTGSMETTILVGDRFFADKFSYLFKAPKKGDVISFNNPNFNYSSNKIQRFFQEYMWGPENVTKRIVGMPGQTVEGVIEDGKPVIYIDGQKIDEPYLNKYPLIDVYTKDPKELFPQVEQEVLKAAMHGQVPMEKFQEVMDRRINRSIRRKSFDPAYSPENQPFYRIKSDRIFRNEQGEIIMLKPGTPLPKENYVKAYNDGKNYWNGTDEFYVELTNTQYWVMGDNREGSMDSRFWGPLDRHFIHGKILFRIWSLDSDEDWWIVDLIKHPIDFWSRMRWNRFLQFVH